MSGEMDRELEARAREAGANYCLAKPFNLNHLRVVVEMLLDEESYK